MGDKGNRIASVYVDDDTHQAMLEWCEITGLSMSKLTRTVLEDMTPVFKDMIKAHEDIQKGKDAQKVLQNMLASGLQLASDRLREVD